MFLEDAQDLGLGAKTHVAHFIEEESRVISAFELAAFGLGGPGEGTAYVAKEFRFDEVLGDGGAIELDEGMAGPLRLGVESPGDQLFPGAGLAIEKNPAIGRGGIGDLLAEGAHRHGLADHRELGAEPGLKLALSQLKFPLADRVADGEEGLLEREGLFDEVVGTEFGGTDSGLDRAVARDHDDTDFGGDPLEPGQGLKAVDPRKPDIEENTTEEPFFTETQTVLSAGDRVDAEAFVLEDTRQRLANAGFVINNQNRVGHQRASPEIAWETSGSSTVITAPWG